MMENISIIWLNTTDIPVNKCPSNSDSPSAHWFKVAVYIVTMVISLGGNILVLCVIYRNWRLRNQTNYLIANLATSDLLMTLFTMCPTLDVLISRDHSWYYGWFAELGCKLIAFMQGTTMACSIFTLTAIAWERFFAIVYPLRVTSRARNSKVIITVAWLLAAIVTSPNLYSMRVQIYQEEPYCIEAWMPPLHAVQSPFIYTIVGFLILYIVPLLIITALYSVIVHKMWFREIPGNITKTTKRVEQKVKKNVIKMLITVVAVFTVFWLPLHLNMFLQGATDIFLKCGPPNTYSFLSYLLSHATGAINVSIYVAFSEDYRKGFKELCVTCFF